jgi:hypothetical protein
MRRYVAKSNFLDCGSDRMSLIWLLHFVHGISITRNRTHVGVGKGIGGTMATSLPKENANATKQRIGRAAFT